MKLIIKGVFFLLLVNNEIKAQRITNTIAESRTNLLLTARKGNRTSYFLKGMPVQLRVVDSLQNEKVVKGFITDLSSRFVEVSSFSGRDTTVTLVAIESIDKLKKLSRAERKKMAWAAGGAVAYSGLMYLILKKPLSSYSYIVFIPAFAVAYILIYYYPATFLWDAINEKSKNRGWRFSTISSIGNLR